MVHRNRGHGVLPGVHRVVPLPFSGAALPFRARARPAPGGWVSKGENAVTVYGLDLDDDSTFTASIVPGSIPAPETWYSKLLDPIFGEK